MAQEGIREALFIPVSTVVIHLIDLAFGGTLSAYGAGCARGFLSRPPRGARLQRSVSAAKLPALDRPAQRSVHLVEEELEPSCYIRPMLLGDEIPEWKALRDALRDLVTHAGGCAAAVVDASGSLWCIWPVAPTTLPPAERFLERELAEPQRVALRRGGRLRVAHPAEPSEDSYLAASFGGIYVLVLWFKGSFDPDFQQARLRRELPRIEALTVALPPPDGPEAGEGAAKQRA